MTTHNIFFIALIIFSLVIKVINLDPHYPGVDVQRDYLVANHIAEHGELPLVGPTGGGGVVRITTPFYYYFLAPFLLIKDSILFLHLVNLAFQTVFLILLYLLAKNMFSPGTALMAVALFSLSNIGLSQSRFIYSPYIGQVFLYCSYLLFLLAYNKKNVHLLTMGVSLYILSFALYGLILATLPLTSLLVILILRQIEASTRNYFQVALVSIFIISLVYLPVFIYIYLGHLDPPSQVVNELTSKFNISPKDILIRFHSHFQYVSASLFSFSDTANQDIVASRRFYYVPDVGPISGETLPGIILMLTMVTSGIIYFFYSAIPFKRKLFSSIIILNIVVYILILSLLRVSYSASWHYVPIFGAFVLLASELLNFIGSSRRILFQVARLAVILLMIQVFIFNFSNFNVFAKKDNPTVTVYGMIDGVIGEIEDIKREENRSDIHFFDIKEYKNDQGLPGGQFLNNPLFWNRLEGYFDTRLVRVLNGGRDSFPGITTINDDVYVFLVCGVNVLEMCNNFFLERNSSRSLVKSVYKDNDSVVYLYK